MKIEDIKYDSDCFKKIIKDAPTDIIIFNKKAKYYCIRIDENIVSICGLLIYKNKCKIISMFTYPDYRKRGYGFLLLKYIITNSIYNVFISHANENSYKIFYKLGFSKVSFKQFKKFQRHVMILKR